MPSSKDLAIAWAALNLRTFPVALIGGSKVPWVRWKDQATTDPTLISAWFDRWPSCVAGVVMEGVCAIDFDRLAAQWEYGYDWPDTFKQFTRRGVHYVYQGDIPCSVKILGPDIDTRGTVDGRGGYIVAYAAPPHDRSGFAPAPRWLADWASARGRRTAEAFADDEDVGMDTPANIRRASERLLSIAPCSRVDRIVPVGYRNNFIYQAAREVQKFDLTRETALELMATLFEWEGRFEANLYALDNAFASRHDEAGILNPERVFADKIAGLDRPSAGLLDAYRA